MKKFTIAVGEVLSCLLLASFTTSYTASLMSKRVELAHRHGFHKGYVSIEELSKGENDRIAFIKATFHGMQRSIRAPLYSGRTIGTVNYIVKVGLGTPARDLLLIIDTGSDLTWTQCLACQACYQQQDPIFDPAASRSYRKVPCASVQCAKLSFASSGFCHVTNATNCDYFIAYLDGSFTTGDFALENLIVDGDIVSTTYPFGCGHQNQGLFNNADGLLGLNKDALSFPAQTKSLFGETFSYCMPYMFSSSAGYIEFGASNTYGEGSMSTPLILVNRTTSYVVKLEYIQVEGTSKKSKPQKLMAMVVDSGTVITRLDRPLYKKVRNAFRKATASLKRAPKEVGMGIFDTCYSARDGDIFPSITFSFMGGLAFTPTAQNSVIPIDNNGTYCMPLLPIDSTLGLSILGNYQQQQYLFTYDIPHSILGISSHVAC